MMQIEIQIGFYLMLLSNQRYVIILGESNKNLYEGFDKIYVKAILSSNLRCRLILSNQIWCKICFKKDIKDG